MDDEVPAESVRIVVLDGLRTERILQLTRDRDAGRRITLKLLCQRQTTVMTAFRLGGPDESTIRRPRSRNPIPLATE